MANPLYHDDPDFYERPGETVHLHVDANPARHVVPAMPWNRRGLGESVELKREMKAIRLAMHNDPCIVCKRPTLNPNGLCSYCTRAQERDETALARAKQPKPSRARISVREGWEVWASGETHPDPEDLGSGHVRSYETRIA